MPLNDSVIISMPGGGGLGNPRRRPVAAVADDVRLGFVSVEAARRDYGVAIDAEGTVDTPRRPSCAPSRPSSVEEEDDNMMRVSAGLPTGMEGLTYPIPFSDPENVIKIAQAAEKFGYDLVWGNDHMTTQHYVRAEFPVPPRFWEPLVTYAFILAETKTLKVGTGILVLPMRHDIVVMAKQIATLDHFGKGRLELGVGIGAYREEFKALQPDAKIDRGDIVDEGLQALNLLFKERVASFDGKYYKFNNVELFPKPLQKRLPIYVGGNNPNNITRTVKWADGWLPAGMHVDRMRAGVKQLREMAEQAGRDLEDYRGLPAIRRACRQDARGRDRELPQEPDEQASGLAQQVDAEGPGRGHARGDQPDRHTAGDRRQGASPSGRPASRTSWASTSPPTPCRSSWTRCRSSARRYAEGEVALRSSSRSPARQPGRRLARSLPARPRPGVAACRAGVAGRSGGRGQGSAMRPIFSRQCRWACRGTSVPA